MSKAYKCDVCGKIFEGNTDLQITLSKGLEVITRFILGIKFVPEAEDCRVYVKDLCQACAESFTKWYQRARARIYE